MMYYVVWKLGNFWVNFFCRIADMWMWSVDVDVKPINNSFAHQTQSDDETFNNDDWPTEILERYTTYKIYLKHITRGCICFRPDTDSTDMKSERNYFRLISRFCFTSFEIRSLQNWKLEVRDKRWIFNVDNFTCAVDVVKQSWQTNH